MRKPIKIWQLGTTLALIMLIASMVPDIVSGIIRYGINVVWDSTYGPDGSIARQHKKFQAESLMAQERNRKKRQSEGSIAREQ